MVTSMKTDKTKKPGIFRYLTVGDVHMGHRQTPTDLIINNFWKTVPDTLLKDIDMLIITGDLFDRQLNNGDPIAHAIDRFITILLYKCERYNVMIRIVEGTPSHDREQMQFFVEQKNNANINVDLHYSKILDIEYIEKLDAYFLYVPDKWNPSTSETLNQVKDLMHKKGIAQVDFTILHGAFKHQLPSIVEEPTHDPEEYLALTKYLINGGHVHVMSVYDRILAAGGFDRLTHNDEIPKGLFDVTVKENGEWTATFLENKGARRYDTLNVHGMDTKQLNYTVKEHIKTLPKGSAIRLRCDPGDVATGDIDTFQDEYPNFSWSILIEKVTAKKNTVSDSLKNFDLSEFLDITPESISDLIIPDIEKFTADAAQIQRVLGLLTEFK